MEWSGRRKEVTAGKHAGELSAESAGWTAQEIVNLIKYVARGEEQYKPRPQTKE